MVDTSVCPICKNPKRSSSAGSLTQWIVACKCDVVESEEVTSAPAVSICRDCGKRIGEGRAGSFTQFIFRSDVCRCAVPKPLKDALDAAEQAEQEFVYLEEEEDFQLQLEDEGFPLQRYKPIAELGSGAGGAVYLAKDTMLNKKVAVKILHMLEPRQLIAFQEEAKATSKLNHKSIVGVIDFGLTQSTAPYMVLEYVPGFSLEEILQRDGTLSWALAQDIFVQVCEAFSYAHSNGVFHRDIKPSNMLLVPNDSGAYDVRIIDFGIAKVKDQDDTKTGKDRAIVGAPLYMSPDVGLGRSYDARSEVYSLGCVIFETLTGRPPFIGDSAFQTLSMHADEKPPQLVQVAEGGHFPKELEELVAKCLAKEPKNRFQNMKELAAAISEIEPFEEFAGMAGQTQTFITKKPKKNYRWISGVAFGIIVPVCLMLLLMYKAGDGSIFGAKPVQVQAILKGEQPKTEPPKVVPPQSQGVDDVPPEVVMNELKLKDSSSWDITEDEVRCYDVKDEDLKNLGDTGSADKIMFTVMSKITGTGFKYLKDKHFSSVTIQSPNFNDDGALEVAKMQSIKRLCILYGNKLTDKGVQALAQGLPKLKYIQFRFNTALPPNVVRDLWPCTELYSMDLGHSDPVTLQQVKDMARFKNLRIVTLTNTALDDQGLAVLAKMPLHSVDMNGSKVTDEGLMKLAECKTLVRIKLYPTGDVTERGIIKFHKLNPGCAVKVGQDLQKTIDMIPAGLDF